MIWCTHKWHKLWNTKQWIMDSILTEFHFFYEVKKTSSKNLKSLNKPTEKDYWLTGTFSSGDQWRSWRPSSSLSRPGEQDLDFVLHIWVQMPQFVGGGVDHVGFCPVSSSGPIFNFLQDNWPVTDDAVGVGLNPKIGGAHSQKLRWSNGCRWSCRNIDRWVRKWISSVCRHQR